MSRNVSDRFRQAMYAPESGDIILACVTLTRPGWPAPQYIVNDAQDLVHQGQTYTRFPSTIEMPNDDEEESSPLMKFVIANASGELIGLIRQNNYPIEANVRFVLFDTPDVVEMEFDATLFTVRDDVEKISGALTVEPILDRSFSKYRFTPETTPGKFP